MVSMMGSVSQEDPDRKRTCALSPADASWYARYGTLVAETATEVHLTVPAEKPAVPAYCQVPVGLVSCITVALPPRLPSAKETKMMPLGATAMLG